MIRAKCFTTLDKYKCYVEYFAALPRKNDHVAVFFAGVPSSLRVVKITHCQENNFYKTPYIIVELHN